MGRRTVDGNAKPGVTLSTQWTGFQLMMAVDAAVVALLLVEQVGQGGTLWLPLAAALAAVALAGVWCVPVLRFWKTGQIIREEGPQSHKAKGGTPTMGGLYVVPVAIAVGWALGAWQADAVAAGLLTLAFGAVGWLDDWQVLRRKSNKGLSPRWKMGLLAIATAAFCLWLGWAHPEVTILAFPGGGTWDLGWAFWPLAAFALLGSSNATNLTDGLDGLAGGTGAIALTGLAVLLAPAQPELAALAAALAGGYLGFLVANRHPARVFMGDTGSLALGGGLAAIALAANQLWALPVLGLVFVGETLSVIWQVTYYKLTKDENGVGRRWFRMAPFHHHLELGGWSETQVVAAFYAVGLGAVAIALLL